MKESPELKSPAEVIGNKKDWDPWASSEGYRRCCTSVEWPGEALAAHLMRAEKLWNHDPFFAYVDRWMTEDNVKWAIELRKVMEAKEMKAQWYERATAPTDALQQELWDKYRKNLPPARGGSAATERAK
jgi:hypothetical protein